MSEYTLKANRFLSKNGIRFSVLNTWTDKCEWDNKTHYKHKVRFYNYFTKKSMTVTFTSSLNDYMHGNTTVTAYDVLSCLTKYEVGTLEDFASEFGYEINSVAEFKRVQRTWKACKREYKGVERVFGSCMEELQDIA